MSMLDKCPSNQGTEKSRSELVFSIRVPFLSKGIPTRNATSGTDEGGVLFKVFRFYSALSGRFPVANSDEKVVCLTSGSQLYKGRSS